MSRCGRMKLLAVRPNDNLRPNVAARSSPGSLPSSTHAHGHYRPRAPGTRSRALGAHRHSAGRTADDASPIPSGWLRFSVAQRVDAVRQPLTADGSRRVRSGAALDGFARPASAAEVRARRGSPADADEQPPAATDVRSAGRTKRRAHRDDAIRAGVWRDESPELRRDRAGRADTTDRPGPRELASRGATLTKTSNMGWIPAPQRASVAQSNASVVASLTAAASGLTGLVTRCAAEPVRSGVQHRFRDSEAAAAATARARRSSRPAVATAYGVNEQDRPRRAARRQSARDGDRSAARGAGGAAGRVHARARDRDSSSTATTEFSYIDLQGRIGSPGLLASDLGGGIDSIHTTERIGIGDVEISARFAAARSCLARLTAPDRYSIPSRPRRPAIASPRAGPTRRAICPTSARARAAASEGRAALELMRGMPVATLAARYAKSFARTVERSARRLSRSQAFPIPSFGPVSRNGGRPVRLRRCPSPLSGNWLSFEGDYEMERVGAPTFEPPCRRRVFRSACRREGSMLPARDDRATSRRRASLLDRRCRTCAVARSIRSRCRIIISRRSPAMPARRRSFATMIQLRLYYRLYPVAEATPLLLARARRLRARRRRRRDARRTRERRPSRAARARGRD